MGRAQSCSRKHLGCLWQLQLPRPLRGGRKQRYARQGGRTVCLTLPPFMIFIDVSERLPAVLDAETEAKRSG
jgi:hypothetical protein